MKSILKKRNVAIILLLASLVTLSQFILAKKHLEMGFFTDEWLFLSTYRAYVVNPFLDILYAWKQVGSHNFGYVYYMGILYNFFGLDYEAYRIFNQILKIISALSLFPLVVYISKNRLLAFFATMIYAIHFSTFGLLDGPSRGGYFLAITLMNLFLLTYFYITKNKLFNIFSMLGLALWLFTTILIGPTRLFPLLALVPLIELLNIIPYKTVAQLKIPLKRLAVIYFPILPLFLFSPQSITVQLHYSVGLLEKLMDGNWQLLMVPFAALGSMYIPKDFWSIFGHPLYSTLGAYLSFLLFSLLPILFTGLLFIIFFISKKPLKFLICSLGINLLTGIIVFFAAHNWLFLDPSIRAAVDPTTYLLPSLIGLFVVINAFCLFLEWKQRNDKNNLLPFIFLGPIFSLVFIFLTWIFADINSIFMGVHAYLTIPAIGTSIVLAVIVLLIYQKLKLVKIFGGVVSILFLVAVFTSYFKISALIVDDFFSYWLKNGAGITDQRRVYEQFWKEVGGVRKYDLKDLPIIYFGPAEEYENGAYYEQVIVWRIASWFDLKFNAPGNNRFQLCPFVILGEEELKKFVSISKDGQTIVDNKCIDNKINTEDLFAFRFKDRNLVPNKEEILKQLEIK